MKARIQSGYVIEILAPIDGFTIDQCFHPDILAQCVDATEGMKVGDVYPPVIDVVAEEIVETPVVEAVVDTPVETPVETPTETVVETPPDTPA